MDINNFKDFRVDFLDAINSRFKEDCCLGQNVFGKCSDLENIEVFFDKKLGPETMVRLNRENSKKYMLIRGNSISCYEDLGLSFELTFLDNEVKVVCEDKIFIDYNEVSRMEEIFDKVLQDFNKSPNVGESIQEFKDMFVSAEEFSLIHKIQKSLDSLSSLIENRKGNNQSKIEHLGKLAEQLVGIIKTEQAEGRNLDEQIRQAQGALSKGE